MSSCRNVQAVALKKWQTHSAPYDTSFSIGDEPIFEDALGGHFLGCVQDVNGLSCRARVAEQLGDIKRNDPSA